jgi:hypothetical protein
MKLLKIYKYRHYRTPTVTFENKTKIKQNISGKTKSMKILSYKVIEIKDSC